MRAPSARSRTAGARPTSNSAGTRTLVFRHATSLIDQRSSPCVESPDVTNTYLEAVRRFLRSELGAHVCACFWDYAS